MIGLSDSYCHAVSGIFIFGGDAANCTILNGPGTADDVPIPFQFISITPTADNNDKHTIERSLLNLQSGLTYYIVGTRTSDHSIQLSATPDGPALTLKPTDALQFAHMEGNHDFGLVEVDLNQPAGSAQEAFYADLRGTTGAGTQRSSLRAGPRSRASTRRPATGRRQRPPRVARAASSPSTSRPRRMDGSPSVTATLAAALSPPARTSSCTRSPRSPIRARRTARAAAGSPSAA